MEGLMRKRHEICDENRIRISKARIRIVHIFAPEIIKTDVANFREVVQRLTGKPTTDDHSRKREKLQDIDAVAVGEDEIWRDANTGGGFLGGFPELDHFPFMVMEPTTHSQGCVSTLPN